MKWGHAVNEDGWRLWFAWRPVRLMDDTVVWLEHVEITPYLDLIKHWRARRAERRRIEEHTDDFWRQVG